MWYMKDMKDRLRNSTLLIVGVLVPLIIQGCASSISNPTVVKQTNLSITTTDQGQNGDSQKGNISQAGSGAQNSTVPQTIGTTKPYRPGISWKPSYSLKDVKLKEDNVGDVKLPEMTVGADVKSRIGKVPLHTIIRRLAELKHMNVSWSSDVDQNARVSVDIKSDDDFWAAIDNVLRQLDYFFKYENNTIIIKYKDTRRFYVTTPFVTGSYQTSAGGDFLGSSGAVDNYHGMLQLDHNDAEIDLWQTIDANLASILQLSTTQVAEENTGPSEDDIARLQEQCRQQYPSNITLQNQCVEQNRARLEQEAASANQRNRQQAAQNSGQEDDNSNRSRGIFYTIDKPLGIITVTAPRSLIEQVDTYIKNLNRELSRQVIIEAKIVEVRLDNANYRGIDWSGLLRNHKLTFTTTFGDNGMIFQSGSWTKFIDTISMRNDPFNIILNFLDEFGDVTVLSNPKISLMNGQPGLITGGKTVRYIDRVTSNINSSGGSSVTTYDVETKDIFQGIGMGVMANIADNGEIILQLSPVTTRLDGEIEYRSFGDAEVGLPKVYLRQITTMARVKDGQMLVIGGIISDEEGTTGNQVPVLGDIPYLGYLFKNETKYHQKVEMVIMLRPHIVEI